jgi:hypothetical protein
MLPLSVLEPGLKSIVKSSGEVLATVFWKAEAGISDCTIPVA